MNIENSYAKLTASAGAPSRHAQEARLEKQPDTSLRGQRGFTLVEISIVLIIVGLLASALFSALAIEQKRRLLEKQLTNFDSTFNSLRNFINTPQEYYLLDNAFGANGLDVNITDPSEFNLLTGGRFPCPADPAAGIGSAAFGTESLDPARVPSADGDNDPTGPGELGDTNPAYIHPCNVTGAMQYVQGPVDPANPSPDDIIIGTLPFRTIGLSGDSGVDAYNNQYSYAVTAGATRWGEADETAGFINNYYIDGAGNATDSNLNSVFVIVSHGENGSGAYNRYGSLVASCPGGAGSLERENCNQDENFIIATQEERRSIPGGGYYDDLASGSLAGIYQDGDGFWDINTADNIFNINGGNNGNVGIGTGDLAANNLSQAKLTLRIDSTNPGNPNVNIPHLLLLNNGTNEGSLGDPGAGTTAATEDSLAVYLTDFAANPTAFSLGDNEAIVFENLDADDANPDDSLYFVNTGNTGTQQLAMLISGDNWVRVGTLPGAAAGIESTAQTADPLLAGLGFLEVPWIYTNGIESSNLRGATSSGITVGVGAIPTGYSAPDDTVGLFTNGTYSLFVDGSTAGPGALPAPADLNGVYFDVLDNDGSVNDPTDFIAMGVNTTNPAGAIDVRTGAGGDFLFYAPGVVSGATSLNNVINGAGTKLLFDVDSGAFRAGYASAAQWDNTNIGPGSIALGVDLLADGNRAVALGSNSTVSGNNSHSYGNANNLTTSDNTYVFGENNTLAGDNVYIIGQRYTVTGDNNTAFGNGTSAGTTINGTGNIMASNGENGNINGDNNTAFLMSDVTVTGNDNFVWSSGAGAGTRNVNADGAIAFFSPGSDGSIINNDNSMGVFLSAANNNITATNSVGYFLDVDGQTLARNNSFVIMGQVSSPVQATDLRVGIGTTNPLSLLDVAGVSRAANHIDYSDQRWKKDISPLEDGVLDKIAALRPVRYKFKTRADGGIVDDDKEQIGFIAQEVRKVFPEIVHTDSEGYMSLNYGAFAAPLTKAIGELNDETHSLMAALDVQDKKLGQLRTQTAQIESNLDEQQRQIDALKLQIGLNNPDKAGLGMFGPLVFLMLGALTTGFFARRIQQS